MPMRSLSGRGRPRRGSDASQASIAKLARQIDAVSAALDEFES